MRIRGFARWLALLHACGAAGCATTVPAPEYVIQDVRTPDGRIPDIKPALIRGSCALPKYPKRLLAAEIEGYALVSFTIDANGSVIQGSERVISSTDYAFEHPSLVSIVTCKFAPAQVGGQPVPVVAREPVTFSIE
jgi:TonB family protein